MAIVKRRIGLEQEFFLVDEAGSLSDRADEFLKSCQFIAQGQGLNPNYFVAEFVKSMVEINTPPADTAKELARVYLKNLKLAISVAQQMGLRLYPLSSYPLPTMPVMRDHPNYHIQARTVGISKFLHAGKCTGTHLHLEVPPGVIDRMVGMRILVWLSPGPLCSKQQPERGREIGFSPEKLIRKVEEKPLSRVELRGFISEVVILRKSYFR